MQVKTAVVKATVTLTAITALQLLGTPVAAAAQDGETQQIVTIVGNGKSLQVDHTTIEAGSIQFRLSTTNPPGQQGGGSDVQLLQLNPGVTVQQVTDYFGEEFNSDAKIAAKGTRDLTKNVQFFGLSQVQQGQPVTVTETLRPGSYYLADTGTDPGPGVTPNLTTFTVTTGTHFEQDSDLRSQVRVRATSADRFITRRTWPHQGTYTFRNTADTIHFMVILPVKDGTTDKQVQAFLDDPKNAMQRPPFAKDGPQGGNGIVSPGNQIQLSYNLPIGTYVLACFIADDKTGMPHAVMGMHRVIHLR